MDMQTWNRCSTTFNCLKSHNITTSDIAFKRFGKAPLGRILSNIFAHFESNCSFYRLKRSFAYDGHHTIWIAFYHVPGTQVAILEQEPPTYIPVPSAFTASPPTLFPNPFAFTARSGIALVDWCSVTIIAPAGFLPWH